MSTFIEKYPVNADGTPHSDTPDLSDNTRHLAWPYVWPGHPRAAITRLGRMTCPACGQSAAPSLPEAPDAPCVEAPPAP